MLKTTECLLSRRNPKSRCYFCICVCVSVCETEPYSEGLAALSSPASAILLTSLSPRPSVSLSLSGRASSVCLLCDHFSHICSLVMAATKPIPPCAYSITPGSRRLFSPSVGFLPEALCRHFETIRWITVVGNLWCLIPLHRAVHGVWVEMWHTPSRNSLRSAPKEREKRFYYITFPKKTCLNSPHISLMIHSLNKVKQQQTIIIIIVIINIYPNH